MIKKLIIIFASLIAPFIIAGLVYKIGPINLGDTDTNLHATNIFSQILSSQKIVKTTSAAGISSKLVFGGRVLKVIPCTNGKLLIIGPPKGGKFLLTPSSKLYMRYSPTTGKWVLGDATPGGMCICPNFCAKCKCPPIPANGTISKIGTS